MKSILLIMEKSKTTSSDNQQIDGEALLEGFRIQNKQNFPFYLKSIWKDLSRRSEDPEKGFCKVIFGNYYDLPGIISTRLFNFLDRDKDGYLSYSEFSKGMSNLFCSNLESLLEFIFGLFDENNDGVINSEDVRTLFQYIPLQKKSFSQNSFKDRIDSQEELHDIINDFFKNNNNMSFKEFKKNTQKENSTIFLYLTVFLLTKKPFNEKTLNFYQGDDKSGNNTPRKEKEDHKPSMIASPNLTSKFQPSLKILHSPIMKNQKDQLKKEILSKYSDPNSLKTSNTVIGAEEDNNVDLLHPSRQSKQINGDGSEKYKGMSEVDMEMLNSITSLPVEDISYEGYLIKLVDDKLKKLWFTLFDKNIYCKFRFFIF